MVVLVLLGLLAGVELTHVLEWPAKTQLPGPEWLAVQNHLYGGYATFGAVAELLILAVSVVLAIGLLVVRDRQGWVFCAVAVAIAAMLTVFALGLQPLNIALSHLSPTALPADWTQLRDRWSAYHTVCFALAFAAFAIVLGEVSWRRPSTAT
ncbi:MAG: hypothetical protein WAM30_10430 [Candidatus Dormiibacterota bacterium]